MKKKEQYRSQTRQVIANWLRIRPNPETLKQNQREQVTPPSLPPKSIFKMFSHIIEDIETVLEHDPAARHALEIILTYPGLHALWLHRISHALWLKGKITVPRVLSHFSRFLTGIEIHPAANIGHGVFIDHGMGIVIGETSTIGDRCLLYKGVLLGGTSLERVVRHPQLGCDVVVGTNACILGALQIGDGAKIGANSVVVRDVPENGTVVGIPAKLVQKRDKSTCQLDHANLPDPVVKALSSILDEIESLRKEISSLKKDKELKE